MKQNLHLRPSGVIAAIFMTSFCAGGMWTFGADEPKQRKPVIHTSAESLFRKIPANLLPPAGADEWNAAGKESINQWLANNVVGDIVETSAFRLLSVHKKEEQQNKEGERVLVVKEYLASFGYNYKASSQNVLKIGRMWINGRGGDLVITLHFLPEQAADVSKLTVGKSYKIKGKVIQMKIDSITPGADPIIPKGVIGVWSRIDVGDCTAK